MSQDQRLTKTSMNMNRTDEFSSDDESDQSNQEEYDEPACELVDDLNSNIYIIENNLEKLSFQ